MWNDDEVRAPMTDAEYEAWKVEIRARLQASLDDPRPALSAAEVDARLDRLCEELDNETDAAA